MDSKRLPDYKCLKIRPGIEAFLKALAPIFKLVVFTAASCEYANFVMSIIDPYNLYLEKSFFHQEHCQLLRRFDRFLTKDLNIVLHFVNLNKSEG